MKKVLSVMTAAALTLSLAGCGATGTSSSSSADSTVSSTETVSSSEAVSSAETASEDLTTVVEGKLTMSTNAAFPPYEMTTDSGDFEGIDVETAQAIADKLGLELQIDDMDFDSALLAVQQGKSDIVMAGVSVTDDRLAVMDFTDSYATGIQSVIVPENSDITSIDDLAGHLIGTQRGTTGWLYCTDDYGEDSVVAYDDGLTAVRALNNGQVDCVVIDNAPAQEFVASNPGLKILDTNYVEEDYAIGVAKGNTAMLNAVNNALKELKADGTLQAIVDKYINAD
ncbi:MAG: ABC transporter substrate-binding protein [Gemmiger sp.]|uniref:ABC transporter substrate-binding protein n=1 Tax=Gemmiger sp. TaxID=2049027 RepID=UPI002E75FE94|nr:ABC transporter substrate-binding protein [Gemmiger sp.]MEE0800047.1 ABC transporter substrate-binding protein [Gemmiger sp.]